MRTKVLTSVWTDAAGFGQASKDFAAEAAKLQSLAASGDVDDLRAQAKTVAQTSRDVPHQVPGEAMMKALLAAAVLACAGAGPAAGADWVTVRNVRVAADDVAATADFYRAAFGMQEIQRYERPGFLEIILNFGRSVGEARAATSTRIALISRRADQKESGVSNMVLNVGDMDAVMKRVTALGGMVEKPPRARPPAGMSSPWCATRAAIASSC